MWGSTRMRVCAGGVTAPLANTPTIRPARDGDLPALADLAMRSKAYWGYDAAFMEACRAELTLSARDLVESQVRVVDGGDGAKVGMVQLVVRGGAAELHKLFVDPARIGTGLGKALMQWAINAACDAGATVMEIEADPDALPFYERMGARVVGEVPSGSIPGRVIPRMELALSASQIE